MIGKKKMNDEIRLVSELTGDTYKNSSGSEIAIIKIANDVLMTSKEMAKMFGVGIPAVNKKLRKIFNSGELVEKQVSSILTHKANDGKLYRTKFYNLQVITSVGSMLKSQEAVNFQNWLVSQMTKQLPN
jgi:hypothetical protein